MDIADKPGMMSVDEVRRVLNEWSVAGFFRVKGLGDKVHLEDIIPRYSYSLRLKSQYENRSVAQKSVPYHGGNVDDRGRVPDKWEMPVRQPTNFEDRTETLPVPHTERVQRCQPCAGDGKVSCGNCHGNGRVTCTFCNGKGYKERTVTRTETDFNTNQPVTRTETVRENCTCFDGTMDCQTCSGRGKVVCSACNGAGRVKTFDQLTVAFQVKALTDVVDVTDLPDQLIGKATGDVVIDERAPRIGGLRPVGPDVDAKANGLLSKSQTVNEKESKLLFQELHVERVGVQEVVYRYLASPAKRLWIYGTENHIHAPDAPKAWGKIWGVISIPVAVVAILILLLIAFAR